MRQYSTFELVFPGEKLTAGQASEGITAEFVHGSSRTVVRGFCDGEGRYAVRFLPEEPGLYHWRITGDVQAEGQEECLSADGGKGPVRAVGTHFEYADGSLFRPFGTTVYALVHQEDALVEETLASLQASPFNKVRMCVFPKHYDYNHNEPPFFPFERRADGSWDVQRPCVPFWRRFEAVLDRLDGMGIQADLILFHPYDRWGFASLTMAENLCYLDYLLRRLAARPNLWWSLANEYDLCMDRKSLADWEQIESYVAEHDPFHHLLSVHNCFAFWDYARPAVTHASIQTKAMAEIPRWLGTWGKPVVVDECCYEGDLPYAWGNISGQEMTRRFWRCVLGGGYCTHGETFLAADEVLWWAKGGRLKGESPARIAFLRGILAEIPGPLEPVPGFWEGLLEDNPPDAPAWTAPFTDSLRRMDPRERQAHLAADHAWAARCGDAAFLWYHDRQCCRTQRITLPENGTYRVELIDPWEMRRQTLLDRARGETVLTLPAREDMVVMALRTDR